MDMCFECRLFTPLLALRSVQTVFALIANSSEAMLADSEAMSVDAFTYLFNLWAERIEKNHNWKWLICGPPNYRQNCVDFTWS
jgi:hypothetical protein